MKSLITACKLPFILKVFIVESGGSGLNVKTLFLLTSEKYLGPDSVKSIAENTQCIMHGFDTKYVFYLFLVKISLVENTRNAKVIIVKYNLQFFQ